MDHFYGMVLFFNCFLILFQMKNNHISLAIILKKTENGYTFESLQHQPSNQDKHKKPKTGRKPLQKGIPNRLIKQIGLINENMVSQNAPMPEPQPVIPYDQEQHQNIPIFTQTNEEQQISCEIDRETDLPKTPAIWFDKLSIHDIQRHQLKEFFVSSQSKTPELYVKYRNFIVDCYLKNPRRYLSKIACRRVLRGDVNTIMRIHDFLEKNGIINFSLNYDGGHTFKENSLGKHQEQRIKPQTFLKCPPQQDEQTAQKQIDTHNMTITVINKNFSRTYRACCFECKLMCGIVWFANILDQQSAQQKNLCFECWSQKNENEKAQYAKIDIVKKMEAHNKDSKNFPKNAWNIEENIKLLDFMSNSQKSWKKLLHQFGGKRTIEDIVLQFLQFPISNLEIKDCKKIYDTQKENMQNKEELIGYSYEDYNKILKEFYSNLNLLHPKKEQKIAQNGKRKIKDKKQQNESFSSKTNDKQNSQEIKQIMALTIEQIQTKLQGLREKSDLVHVQSNFFDDLNSYKNKQIKLNAEEEISPNCLGQSDNKSRMVKNSQQGKDQNLNLLEERELSN